MIELLNCDCIDYMKECEDNQFDLAVVDPPYFDGPNKLGYFGKSVSSCGVIRGGYEKTNTWELPTEKYFSELIRISENQIIWGINYYDIKNIGPGRIVWDKVNSKNSFSDCEIAYCSMHESVRMFSYMWNGMMQGKSISEGRTQIGNKKLNEKRIHPTQKPIILYEWIFMNYAYEGMKVIDTHLGSGSVCIAAHNAGINLTGCELNQDYYEKAKDRIESYQSQMSF